MNYDINSAAAAYASSFGNNERRLIEWLNANGISSAKDDVIKRVREVESAVVEQIFSGSRTFTGRELEQMIIDYCKTHEPDIKGEGIRSILDYCAWMAWHEGYLADR